MDGLPNTFPLPSELWSAPSRQHTLKAPICCVGIGLHSGAKVRMELRPAAIGTGIVFRRSDLGVDIPARFDHVVDTRLCTVLGLPGRPEARVATVEHVMAALFAAGVTNALVEVDGPELPILDGSAVDFLFLIDCAGVVAQDAPSMRIDVLRPVRVEQGAAYAELRPCATGFELSVAISFEAAAIGRQALSLRFSPEAFREDLARARTFTNASDVAQLQKAGLALGGSLDNAVVVDGARVLNPGGLRMADEFVRHKMLDTVGDLALAGASLHGRLVSSRSGHTLNNRLLHALFADDSNWVLTEAETPLANTAIAAQVWAEQSVAA